MGRCLVAVVALFNFSAAQTTHALTHDEFLRQLVAAAVDARIVRCATFRVTFAFLTPTATSPLIPESAPTK